MPAVNPTDVLIYLKMQANPPTDYSTFARNSFVFTSATVRSTTSPTSLALNGGECKTNITAGTFAAFGTGDFTIEMDVHTNGGDTGRSYAHAIPSVGLGWSIDCDASSKLSFAIYTNAASKTVIMTSAAVVTTSTLTTRTIAVVRSGTTMRFFVNGVLTDTATISLYNFTGEPTFVSCGNPSGATTQGIVNMPGLYNAMANFRITKAALYTTTYTRSGSTAWGYLPVLSNAYTVPVTKLSTIFSGKTVTTKAGHASIPVTNHAYNFTFNNINVNKSIKLSVTKEIFSFLGLDVTPSGPIRISIPKASYIFSGNTINRILPLKVPIIPFTYTFTSQSIISRQILNRSVIPNNFLYSTHPLFGRVPYARFIPHMNFLWSTSPIVVKLPVRVNIDSLSIVFSSPVVNLLSAAKIVVDNLYSVYTTGIAYLKFGSAIVIDTSSSSFISSNILSQRYTVIQSNIFTMIGNTSLPIFSTNSTHLIDPTTYTFNGKTTYALLSKGQYYTSGPRIYV